MRLALLPRQLPATQRRWILLNAIAITAVLNLVINAAIAWLSAAGTTRVPLWATPIVGGPSTITDTVGTLFVLPLITNLLVTTAVRRDLRHGRLTHLNHPESDRPILRALPRSGTRRGVGLGVCCVAGLGPAAVAILIATDPVGLSVTGFVLYKAILGVTLGTFVTPMIALRAMADDSVAQPAVARSRLAPSPATRHGAERGYPARGREDDG
jgi:hypothetical protein